MTEMIPLISITTSAFRVAWRKHFLWWLALPTSALIGLSSFATKSLHQNFLVVQEQWDWIHLLPDTSTTKLIVASVLAYFLQSALRGPIILLLNKNGRGADRYIQPIIRHYKELFRAFLTSLLCESIYVVSVLVIFSILAIPIFFSWKFNPGVFPVLAEIGFLILLALTLYLYFIKELALLYALLGQVRPSSAFELGLRLYRRRTIIILLFFLFAALLMLFFVSITEFLFLACGLSRLNLSLSDYLITALPIGFYFVFDQALRITFFNSIASTPKQTAPATTLLESKPNESPSGIVPN
jgi:hypothetical protein